MLLVFENCFICDTIMDDGIFVPRGINKHGIENRLNIEDVLGTRREQRELLRTCT